MTHKTAKEIYEEWNSGETKDIIVKNLLYLIDSQYTLVPKVSLTYKPVGDPVVSYTTPQQEEPKCEHSAVFNSGPGACPAWKCGKCGVERTSFGEKPRNIEFLPEIDLDALNRIKPNTFIGEYAVENTRSSARVIQKINELIDAVNTLNTKL